MILFENNVNILPDLQIFSKYLHYVDFLFLENLDGLLKDLAKSILQVNTGYFDLDENHQLAL